MCRSGYGLCISYCQGVGSISSLAIFLISQISNRSKPLPFICSATGDEEFDSDEAQDRPSDWAQSVLALDFYESSSYTTSTSSVVFGNDIFARVTTDTGNEALNSRVTRCWATENNDDTEVPNFELITGSCIKTDPATSNPLAWVSMVDADNGASSTVDFNFRSFRFPGTSTWYLHCTGDL